MHVGRPVILFALAAGWLAALVATAGSLVGPRLAPDEVTEVIERLQETFVDNDRLSRADLNEAAIQGIIDYLEDPYTSYLSAPQYERFRNHLDGPGNDFEGIGAEVTSRGGRIMVLGPLPGSPASRAGVRAGDVILGVDGQSIEGKSVFEAVQLIRGPKGTEVVLRLLRAGEVRPIDVAVVRDTISISSVSPRTHAAGVGYIRLSTFDKPAPESFRNAIAELREDGAAGLILDLRGNTGGLVDSAVAVVSEFVEDGLVFRWRGGDGSEEEYEVSGEGTAYDLPLVVLVDGFSASAAEIVAGALQDHGRATVVGTRTFGKGSVNILSPLQSGAGLYITTARWLTPKGRLIEGVGLEPDIAVGTSVDVQAVQRIGTLTRSLCDGFEGDAEALAERPELAGAIERLCNVQQEPPAPSDADEAFDAAVEELRRLIGG